MGRGCVMKTARGILFFGLMSLTGLPGWAAPDSYRVPEGTNVIMIVIDTLRADHLGSYGYHRNTSPNLDRFAEESLFFENVVATSCWTPPGTGSILTGLYPKNHKVFDMKAKLPREVPFLPQILKDQGYHTFGFSTNSLAGERMGFDRGYDVYYMFPTTNKRPGRYLRSEKLHRDLFPFLESMEEKENVFLYIHYTDPHIPYDPGELHYAKENKMPEKWTRGHSFVMQSDVYQKLERLEQKRVIEEMINRYDDEILYMDKSIEKLFELLKKKGLYDKSIIIVVSDHGEAFKEHYDLGHWRTLYDEEIMVPLMIRLPAGEPRRISQQFSQVHIVPTLLDLLGIPQPAGLDGISLFSDEPLPEYAYAHLITKHTEVMNASRSPHHKMILTDISKKVKKTAPSESPPGENGTGFRWFDENVRIRSRRKHTTFELASASDGRRMQVFIDDRLHDEFILNRKRQKIEVERDEEKDSVIMFKTLDPCVKSNTKSEKGIRVNCRSFRMFERPPLKFHALSKYELVLEEYYDLQKDPVEQVNMYRDKERDGDTLFQKILGDLRQFIRAERKLEEEQEAVEFDKQQLEVLRSLGYLQ